MILTNLFSIFYHVCFFIVCWLYDSVCGLWIEEEEEEERYRKRLLSIWEISERRRRIRFWSVLL